MVDYTIPSPYLLAKNPGGYVHDKV